MAATYVLANCAALVSHVPGGVGVIEAVVATLISDSVLAALIVFRGVYFLFPFILGMILLLISEFTVQVALRTQDDRERPK